MLVDDLESLTRACEANENCVQRCEECSIYTEYNETIEKLGHSRTLSNGTEIYLISNKGE